MLVLAILGPSLVVASSPETSGGAVEETGSLLVGLLVGSLLALPIAFVAGLAATYAALRFSLGRVPPTPGGPCDVSGSVDSVARDAGRDDVNMTGFVVLAGMLPAGVRIGFAYLERSDAVNDLVQTPTDLA